MPTFLTHFRTNRVLTTTLILKISFCWLSVVLKFGTLINDLTYSIIVQNQLACNVIENDSEKSW